MNILIVMKGAESKQAILNTILMDGNYMLISGQVLKSNIIISFLIHADQLLAQWMFVAQSQMKAHLTYCIDLINSYNKYVHNYYYIYTKNQMVKFLKEDDFVKFTAKMMYCLQPSFTQGLRNAAVGNWLLIQWGCATLLAT